MDVTKLILAEKKSVKSKLTRLQSYITSLGEQFTLLDLNNRFNSLETLLDKFEKAMIQIQANTEDEATYAALEAEMADFETKYYNTVSLYEEKINNLKNSQSHEIKDNTQVQINNINLPPINLKKFNGNYNEWISFFDLFNSLVHEHQALNNTQKFHYLKSCLEAEAAQTISSLTISASNYDVAWNLLKERYQNKRLIVQTHVHALFSLPTIQKANSASLRSLIDNINTNLRSLSTLGLPTGSWDTLIIYLITGKLDFHTKRDWEASIHGTELPTFDELMLFLKNRCQTLEAMEQNKPCSNTVQNHHEKVIKTKFSVHKANSFINTEEKQNTSSRLSNEKTRNLSCPACKHSHFIYQCDTFKSLAINDRIKFIQKNNLCLNCLRSGHKVQDCRSTTCRQCNNKHNTMLHVNEKTTLANQSEVNTSITTHSRNKTIPHTQVVLSTAVIKVYSNGRDPIECRALLDVGSQSNFITETLCRKLKLPKKQVEFQVGGINGNVSRTQHTTSVKFKSRFNSYTKDIKCLVLPKITSNIPNVSFPTDHLWIPENVNLADPYFNKAAEIDILLGAELFWELLCVGRIKLSNTELSLHKTLIGWVVGGTISHSPVPNFTHCNTSRLEHQVSKFWEIEEVNLPETNSHTIEEKLCEAHFTANYRRNETGRFVVKLPLRSDKTLGNSRDQALTRFLTLEKKFNRDSNLRFEYTKFINEYIALGHMELVKQATTPSKHFYLPHHAVFKADSATTKLRVVFDGSAKTDSKTSLNDILMVGPTLQQDLFSILTRFRTHKFVITSDITKMYRQVVVDESDRDLQRILWRPAPNEKIQTYRLTTVTYGTASASFQSIRCLQQAAVDAENEFPIASEIIRRDFYVDDLLTGSNTLHHLQQIINDVSAVLSGAGFKLAKWKSNVTSLNTNQSQDSIRFDKEIVKTLGLLWNSTGDTFKFEIAIKNPGNHVTKRSILSSVSQIFDPMGLIAPVITTAKLFIQRLWQLKLAWDESVPIDIHNQWQSYKNQLSDLNNVNIPRRIIQTENTIVTELHCFCDASQLAYGACIYLRTKDTNNKYITTLICAKSRVVPLKLVTIPRLELCAALLLAKLKHKLLQTLNIPVDRHFNWSDSTIVLSWLATPSRDLKTFVGNRVSQILSLTELHHWSHVRSEDNPADLLSRGCTPRQLLDTGMWITGPAFLSLEENQWVSQPIVPATALERRITNAFPATHQINDIDLFVKFSSYTKLQRVIAYCLRFYHNARYRQNKRSGNLTAAELQQATYHIIKSIQQFIFHEEIKNLKKQEPLPRQSKLLSLAPFLDDHNLIRVGGRLKNANISFDKKHPIILPNHFVTKLIINQYHHTHLHAGPQLTLAALREKYWPLSGRSIVRQVIHKCITCFKAKPKSIEQMMGDLPHFRIEQTRAFTHTGTDFAGPIQIKEGRGRGKRTTKAYIALFVCLATKAVHIELVTDLTTESFLAALKRFISRRGMISHIYSDNATNFVGANRELQDIYDFTSSPEFTSGVINTLTQRSITWHYIPPRAPHFGAMWEINIKSVKHHLRRIIGNALVTYEEMYTLLTQIEAVLNSRPLTPLSNSPNDLDALTPGHFLIGSPITAPIEADATAISTNRLSRWQRIQQLSQHFWKRWKNEYLGQLQQRSKWKTHQPNLQPGSLVVVKEDNTPPLQWALARVVELHPGQDGLVRAVTIQTSSGIFKRPIVKLCPLPLEPPETPV